MIIILLEILNDFCMSPKKKLNEESKTTQRKTDIFIHKNPT